MIVLEFKYIVQVHTLQANRAKRIKHNSSFYSIASDSTVL